ncbi:hypothetical protein, partial [Streptomyces plicatus]|uniref:hypothetical protein n=1 Tax=Streptomyces plicatus TaxID=1922 RepID=UPI001C704928
PCSYSKFMKNTQKKNPNPTHRRHPKKKSIIYSSKKEDAKINVKQTNMQIKKPRKSKQQRKRQSVTPHPIPMHDIVRFGPRASRFCF